MNRRHAVAVLALLGSLDATYLLMHKLGYIGSLVCTVGSDSCNVVNTSSYSAIFGIPVAGIGLLGYVVIFALAVVGSEPSRLADVRVDRPLAVLSGGGVAFSLYLTYVSFFHIGTACPWCLLSLTLIVGIFAISLWGVFEGASGSEREREESGSSAVSA